MPHCNKQMISFFLTTRCNLSCIYCYNKQERAKLKEHTLSLEIAKAGIDYFFENNMSRHIRFYGPGEPTQEFELMKNITDYAREVANGQITSEIQTNGAFDDNTREWLSQNMNIIWISFDGPPDIHDANRPLKNGKASSPIIERNVNHFNKSKKDGLLVGARVTMTDRNVARQIEMIDYFQSIGISYIWTDPLFPTVDKIPVLQDYSKQHSYHFDMEKYIDNFIEAHTYANSKGVFYGSFLACNFDGETQYHCRACTPVPHLTPDGYVSACDMVLLGEKAYHMDEFVYGKWDENSRKFIFFQNKIINLQNRKVDNMQHCIQCDAKLYCGGYCLGEVLNETGSLMGQKAIVCKAIQRLLKEIGPCKPYMYLHP